MIVFDDWQQEILDYDKDILLIKGRRIGGTEIFAIKAAKEMAKKKTGIIMTSLTEDQAQLIISVCFQYLAEHHPKLIAKGKNKPTLNSIDLINGSWILVRPVGTEGKSARGFGADIVGIDEAPQQPRKMWASLRPVITTTNGRIWMWGTPQGQEGYPWEQFKKAYINKDPKARFKVWYKTTEQVLFNRPICASWTQEQLEGAKRILQEEKESMSEIEYGNEYLGLFLDELQRFFDDDWIEKVCTGQRHALSGDRYLGVDIGRGYDPSAFADFVQRGERVYQVDCQITKKTTTLQTQNKIIEMDRANGYVQIGIDAGSGALGVGVYDNIAPILGSKLVAMNNRSIALDRDGKKKQTLMKNDYYQNMKAMGEQGKLVLLDDPSVKASLRSIRLEIADDEDDQSTMRIVGADSHIAEACIRGCELAKKAKFLAIDCA